MKIEPGTRLGPYEVVAPIGAGGMGEVYQARDSRLDRSVAIKVLPAALGANPQLRLRFEREAKAISSLAHPHICVLHDVGRESETDFLVMELLDGETLEERIRKGPMPVEDVLTYAIQIANALEQAHRQGIVHRDLKPSNVMITRSGAKLLDFGLSKTLEGDGPALVDLSGATEHLPITTEGTIVGTFQYMAPEQVEGKAADARTDIFAFGAVMYEMLTGKRAFAGKSRASAIAAILATEPPSVSSLRPLTPSALDRVIRICLDKDPDDRWQSAHDLRLELEFIRDQGTEVQAAIPAKGKRILPWLIAALIATGAALAAWIDFRSHHQKSPQWFHVAPPEGARFSVEDSPVAVSPDGRFFVFRLRSGSSEDRSQLWVRSVDSLALRPLNGTERAYDAFWSWDGKQIGFFVDDKLKRMDATGGPATTVATIGDAWGGAWAEDGSILVAGNGPILRYPPDGGAAQPVTQIDKERKQIGHRRPQMLPDGRHFLYLALSSDSDLTGVYVAPVTGGAAKRLLDIGSAAIHSGRDHLLFHHNGNLYAQKFDLGKLATSGPPFVVAEQVSYVKRWESPGYAASRNGVLAYHPSGGFSEPRIDMLSRDGKNVTLGEVRGSNVDLSRDDTRLAVQRSDPETQIPHIWIYDLVREVSSRLTFGKSPVVGPVWSPDGAQIAFTALADDRWQIRTRRSSGVGAEETIFDAPQRTGFEVVDWSRDGRHLLAELYPEGARGDLVTIDLTANPIVSTPFIATPSNEHSGRFSHDGRWIAYMSDESGQPEIYVQPFPPDGSRWQISNGGGAAPRWRADTRELLYLARGRSLVSVAISTENGFTPAAPVPIAEVTSQDFVITSDAQRVLVSQQESVVPYPIVVARDWDARR